MSVTRDDFSFTKIEDLEEIAQSSEIDDGQMTNATIIGVRSFDSFNACYACNGKVIETTNNLGDCSRCFMTQLFDRSDLRYTARIDLKSETSPVMTFTVFSPVLDDICQGTVSKNLT